MITCIAICRSTKNEFIMIGDRCVSDGHGSRLQLPHSKIVKVGNSLVGGCGGLTAMAYILTLKKELKNLDYAADLYAYMWNHLAPKIYEHFDKHKMREIDPSEDDTNLCELLIASQNKVYVMDINQRGFELYETTTPLAVGSGQPYWMSAFTAIQTVCEPTKNKKELQSRMVMAMDITAKLVNHVDNNVDVLVGGGIRYE